MLGELAPGASTDGVKVANIILYMPTGTILYCFLATFVPWKMTH
jgi:hypothetical protein